MPTLIKNITASLVDDAIGEAMLITQVYGEVQGEDYINLGGFIAYLQNFSRVEESIELIKPELMGLKNTKNLIINNINIDY